MVGECRSVGSDVLSSSVVLNVGYSNSRSLLSCRSCRLVGLERHAQDAKRCRESPGSVSHRFLWCSECHAWRCCSEACRCQMQSMSLLSLALLLDCSQASIVDINRCYTKVSVVARCRISESRVSSVSFIKCGDPNDNVVRSAHGRKFFG